VSISDVAHAAYTTAESFDLIVIGMGSGAEVSSAGASRGWRTPTRLHRILCEAH
jgi:hypothetical protein